MAAEDTPVPVLSERPPFGVDYVKVLTATAISRTGDGITQAALPLLAAKVTGDVRQVAWIYGAMQAPWFGLPLYAGVLADRVNRRTMIAASDLARAAFVATLAASVLRAIPPLWLLYLVAIGLGVGEVCFEAASAAVVPSVVDERNYERASGQLSAASIGGMNLFGPAIGAALFEFSRALPFLFDALTFLIGVLLIWSLNSTFRGKSSPSDAGESPGGVKQGVSWLWRNRTTRALSLSTGMMNVAMQCVFAPLALFATDTLKLSDAGFGLLLAGTSIGSIVGGALAHRVVDRIGPGLTVQAGMLLTVVAVVGGGVGSTGWAVGAVLSLAGIGQVLFQVVSHATRMAVVPDHLRGRVTGAYMLIAYSGAPLGALIGGAVAHRWGLRAPFVVAAIIIGATMVASMRPLADHRLREARATRR